LFGKASPEYHHHKVQFLEMFSVLLFQNAARFEVLTVILLKVKVFWDIINALMTGTVDTTLDTSHTSFVQEITINFDVYLLAVFIMHKTRHGICMVLSMLVKYVWFCHPKGLHTHQWNPRD
jgi:hypothetical protein